MSKKKSKSYLKDPQIKKEEFEVHYWSLKLGCSKEELINALANVGISESRVNDILSKKDLNC